MLEPRIQQQFYDAADLFVQQADVLSRPLAAAADLMLSAITGGGKLLLAGTGTAHADALQAAAVILGATERRRPGLPALALGADPVAWVGLMQTGGDPLAPLTRQVHALGLPGDVLVLFEPPVPASGPASDGLPSLGPLIQAAHTRELSVVLWTAGSRDAPQAPSAEWLTDIDVHVPLQADRALQAGALLRLSWQAVVDAVELQLLGDLE